jgi:hypothetical protein
MIVSSNKKLIPATKVLQLLTLWIIKVVSKALKSCFKDF